MHHVPLIPSVFREMEFREIPMCSPSRYHPQLQHVLELGATFRVNIYVQSRAHSLPVFGTNGIMDQPQILTIKEAVFKEVTKIDRFKTCVFVA